MAVERVPGVGVKIWTSHVFRPRVCNFLFMAGTMAAVSPGWPTIR